VNKNKDKEKLDSAKEKKLNAQKCELRSATRPKRYKKITKAVIQ